MKHVCIEANLTLSDGDALSFFGDALSFFGDALPFSQDEMTPCPFSMSFPLFHSY